jgi:endonuclease/exonuclease/phosphatase family metal-dependent hydrolase
MFGDAGYCNLITANRIRTTRNKYVWEKFPDTPQLDSDFMFVGPGVKVIKFEVPDILVSDHLPMLLEIE